MLRRDKSETSRGRFLARLDVDDEDTYSFSGRCIRGFGHSRKELYDTRSPSLRYVSSPSPRVCLRSRSLPPTHSGVRSDDVTCFKAKEETNVCSGTDDSSPKSKRSRPRTPIKPIKLGPVLTAGGFKNYQMEVYLLVIAASNRSSARTLRWIREVETSSRRKLERKQNKNWDDIERVLADAVVEAVKGKAKRELLNYKNEMMKHKFPLYGRVAL